MNYGLKNGKDSGRTVTGRKEDEHPGEGGRSKATKFGAVSSGRKAADCMLFLNSGSMKGYLNSKN